MEKIKTVEKTPFRNRSCNYRFNCTVNLFGAENYIGKQ
jgi:hypothetical protein